MKRAVKLDKPKIVLSILAKCNPGTYIILNSWLFYPSNYYENHYAVHVIKASTALRQIVRSEPYSDEEFAEVVNKLGKPW